MDIRAIAFDVNGTLIRIQTEDGDEQIFRSAAHFLTYQGIDLHRDQVRDLYFQIMKEQLRASPEEYPEFDAVGIWGAIIDGHMTDFTRALPAGKLRQLPLFLAEMSRGIARRRLGLYPFVCEVLDVLRGRMTKRNVDIRCLELGAVEKISGDKIRRTVTVKVGVPQDRSKQIQKLIKDSKLKVAASIQGDAVRVSGAKRDDLQAAIQLVRGSVADLPLQFVNFRD